MNPWLLDLYMWTILLSFQCFSFQISYVYFLDILVSRLPWYCNMDQPLLVKLIDRDKYVYKSWVGLRSRNMWTILLSFQCFSFQISYVYFLDILVSRLPWYCNMDQPLLVKLIDRDKYGKMKLQTDYDDPFLLISDQRTVIQGSTGLHEQTSFKSATLWQTVGQCKIHQPGPSSGIWVSKGDVSKKARCHNTIF